MTDETVKPCLLEYAGSEPEAAIIVAALRHAGINAHAEGGIVSGFRAEAPGGVKVIVPESELNRARNVLGWQQDDTVDISGSVGQYPQKNRNIHWRLIVGVVAIVLIILILLKGGL